MSNRNRNDAGNRNNNLGLRLAQSARVASSLCPGPLGSRPQGEWCAVVHEPGSWPSREGRTNSLATEAGVGPSSLARTGRPHPDPLVARLLALALPLALTGLLVAPVALAWTEADRRSAERLLDLRLQEMGDPSAQTPKAVKPAAGQTPTPKPAEAAPVAAPVASEAVRLIDASMLKIPAGSFQMGCSPGDGACDSDEKPPHPIKVPGFRMGKTEVTQAQWKAVMDGANPSHFQGDDRPVEQVSWDDAQAFLKRLNANNPGKPYRLPGEAEWEYAARAGTTTPYWWGKDLGKGNANCAECGGQWAGKETAPVGSFKVNPFGLFDTTGNVWEWVQDCWHDSYAGAPTDGSQWHDNCSDARRVLRGGSWGTSGRDARVSDRARLDAGGRDTYLGLRLAQDL